MTTEQLKAIRSKKRYWVEVSERKDDSRGKSRGELIDIVGAFGEFTVLELIAAGANHLIELDNQRLALEMHKAKQGQLR